MKTTAINRDELTGNVIVEAKNTTKSGATKKLKANVTPEAKKAEDAKAKSEAVAPKTKVAEVEQPQTSQVVAETPQPQAEPTKVEIKEQLKEEKPALNLDSTIKLIETLHRRKIQRDKLLDTIETLEAFEVAQLEDADETDTNKFQRCELTIEDDKGNEFTTKNPFIINAVAQFVNGLCIDKLAEIEGGIALPA